MRITLESTSKIVTLDGIEARIWEGKTERGVPIVAFIPRVAVRREDDAAEFERELLEKREPSAEVQVFPTRLVL